MDRATWVSRFFALSRERTTMKLLALCSSPRLHGNSSQLAEAALAGAREAGAQTERVDLNRLKLRGCQADRACKQDGRCCVKDDMQSIYPKIEQADAIVFASPIYGFTVNAQMKTMLDRLYAFLRPDLSTRLQPGKRSALIVTQGWADEAEYLPYLAAVPKSLEVGGLGRPEILVGAGLMAPSDLDQRPELIERARQLGQHLVQASA
jgi:multimeric flavodoxin WrbA